MEKVKVGFSRIFIRAIANQLVRSAYRGVLGREPDEAAAGYIERIKRGGSLDDVLAEIVFSDEARRRFTSGQLVTMPDQKLSDCDPVNAVGFIEHIKQRNFLDSNLAWNEIKFSDLPEQCFRDKKSEHITGLVRYSGTIDIEQVYKSLRIQYHGGADPAIFNTIVELQSCPNHLSLTISDVNSRVFVESQVVGNYNLVFFHGDQKVVIGSKTTCNSLKAMLCQGGILHIGEDNMLAEGVKIHVGDNHAIFDIETLQVANLKSNPYVVTGKHVWLGQGSALIGDISVGDGSIVAAYSVATKNIPNYVLVAGVPAAIRKNNISWTRDYFGMKASINSALATLGIKV